MILDEPSRHRNRIGIRVGHWEPAFDSGQALCLSSWLIS